MTVINLRAHARKASIARVEAMTKAHAEFQAAKAAEVEADRQRQMHVSALDHVISAAWVAPTLGPELTRKAVAAICERLAHGNTIATFRDSLELITAGKE